MQSDSLTDISMSKFCDTSFKNTTVQIVDEVISHARSDQDLNLRLRSQMAQSRHGLRLH